MGRVGGTGLLQTPADTVGVSQSPKGHPLCLPRGLPGSSSRSTVDLTGQCPLLSPSDTSSLILVIRCCLMRLELLARRQLTALSTLPAAPSPPCWWPWAAGRGVVPIERDHILRRRGLPPELLRTQCKTFYIHARKFQMVNLKSPKKNSSHFLAYPVRLAFPVH